MLPRQFIKDSISYSTGDLFPKIIGLAILPLIIKNSTLSELGTMVIVLMSARLLEKIIGLAMPRYFLHVAFKAGSQFFSFPLQAIALGFAVGLALFFSYISQALDISNSVFNFVTYWQQSLILISAVLLVWMSILMFYLRGSDQALAYVALSILQSLGKSVCFILWTFYELGDPVNLLLLIEAFACIFAISGFYILYFKQVSFKKPELSGMFNFCSPLWPTEIATAVKGNADKILVEAFFGATAVGLLEIFNKLATPIRIIASAIQKGWLSLVYRFQKNSQDQDIIGIDQTIVFSIWLQFIVSLIIVFASPDILYLLEKTPDSTTIYFALLINLHFLVQGVANQSGSSLFASERTFDYAKVYLFLTVFHFSALFLLLKVTDSIMIFLGGQLISTCVYFIVICVVAGKFKKQFLWNTFIGLMLSIAAVTILNVTANNLMLVDL